MIEEFEIVNIRKIKSLSTSRLLYDIEVEDNHNFFANGILTHNSGTAFRTDGNDMMIYATTGDIIHRLNAKTLINEGWLVKPLITFIKEYMPKELVSRWEDECETGLINETPNYSNFYIKFIAENEYRNNLVLQLVKENEGKKILILTKLIEHGKKIHESILNSQHLHGSVSKDNRKKMFENFVSGKANVLVSTISIFAEGIDIPSLDMVINAAANKGDVKTIQVLGRILRKMKGKSGAFYYDFIDESRFFRLASYARRKALIKEGHEVEMINV